MCACACVYTLLCVLYYIYLCDATKQELYTREKEEKKKLNDINMAEAALFFYIPV